jgi:hypothetical protein
MLPLYLGNFLLAGWYRVVTTAISLAPVDRRFADLLFMCESVHLRITDSGSAPGVGDVVVYASGRKKSPSKSAGPSINADWLAIA